MSDQHLSTGSESADRYQLLFETSADAMLIIEDNRFVDCNQAAVDILGLENKAALLRSHPADLSPPTQPDGRSSADKANEIMANIVHCRSQRFEWDHVRADGTLLPVEVSMTAIPSGDSYTLNIVWRDLSDRRRLEKELQHSQKMEALGSLAGGIAHDFNNTLVPIVTYSDLLARSLQDQPKLENWAQEIGRAGILAGCLVRKLLAVSRQDDRTPETLDLERTVLESLGMLRKLIGEDIEVCFNPTGGPLWVQTSPGDVEQVLLNLAANARDALPAGGTITLTLSVIEQSEQSFARLEFSDNGCGMDPETLENLFVPFFTTKEPGSGTGLGMASVHEVVTKANGKVRAESAVGVGTTIEVLLPVTAHPESESGSVDKEQSSSVDDNGEKQNAHILIVEDDTQIMRVICGVLSDNGYRISAASHGCLGLDAIETNVPDLILTDIIMPQMSGPLMVKEMNARGIHTPVLFLSGYSDRRLRAHGFDPADVSLLRKPFTAGELLAQVRKALAANRKVP